MDIWTLIANLEAAVASLQATVADQAARIEQLEALAHSHPAEPPAENPEA